MTENGWRYLAKSIEALEKKPNNKSPYDKVFEEMARLLGGDGAFSYYGNIQSCIYINYWLNKYIQKEHNSIYNENTFEFLKEFAHNYSKIKHSNELNSCKKYIRVLSTNESQKMEILYMLYDYYDKFMTSVQFNNLEQKCTNLGIIFHHYQNILSSHEKYKDIISQLESLKNLILKIESKHNLRCSSTMSKIVFPKEESSDSVKHPEAHSMKISLPDELTKHQSSVLEHNRGGTSTMGVLGLKGTIDSQTNILQIPRESAEIEQPRREQPEIKPLEMVQEEVSLEQASLPKATFTRYTTEEPEDTHASIRSLDIPRAQNNDTGLNVSPYPGDGEGIMKKINTVISDTLGSVDPAPVLGVSGGMGILFVLFKLDHSLEEEEDECIKFLELLEDFHQENSQIFMNMMVDLLDMLQ
ncbi:Plasmodium vivax Vir protein, putative [Plasmodium vivax]|uniref:Vir protein, putative n=1 Tax=Plasmodium vivax TaxID=5855 RepID=A0A1G4ECU1_PLAVI|nr:Plasmodium vivax Vir protein, putative [Plasmodium vivax]